MRVIEKIKKLLSQWLITCILFLVHAWSALIFYNHSITSEVQSEITWLWNKSLSVAVGFFLGIVLPDMVGNIVENSPTTLKKYKKIRARENHHHYFKAKIREDPLHCGPIRQKINTAIGSNLLGIVGFFSNSAMSTWWQVGKAQLWEMKEKKEN